ncbi:hypothetical protein E1267_34570 [Nonomuraea longispora]|uniref:NADP-dependent oxidoreductase n=1 Tax=Nonomuraea longispora TaxID=1848320 RepID=A0A4R4MW31_9ACTN|nr:hypothetical protein [Nonomuraea longispora]TDC00471.1 hypothetical protein E1267_34570 [Nonomuraea longispora]
MMKALVAREYGPPELLRIEDLPIPEPGPGRILVRVAAASLNPADLMLTSGAIKDDFGLGFPYVPGTARGKYVVSMPDAQASRPR